MRCSAPSPEALERSRQSSLFCCAECNVVHTVLLDEIPIITNAQTRAVRYRKTTIGADCLRLVRITAQIHRRNGIGHVRPNQRHLVEMSVGGCSHHGSIRRAAGVVLHVYTEPLAKMSDLQIARNPHIVFGVGVYQIAAAAEDEGSLPLESAHMFAD